MHFIIQWTLMPERRDEIQGRFLETGAPPPEGVEMLGRWHRVAGGGGLCIAKSEDPVAIARWVQGWSDGMTFQVDLATLDEDAASVMRGTD